MPTFPGTAVFVQRGAVLYQSFFESSNVSDKWYFASDNKKTGPFSATQLKELAALGKIQPDDTVWKEGVEKGVPAAKVKSLFSHTPGSSLPGNGELPVAPSPALSQQPMAIAPSLVPESASNVESSYAAPNDRPAPGEECDQLFPDGQIVNLMPEGSSWSPLPGAVPVHGLEGTGKSGKNSLAASPAVLSPEPKGAAIVTPVPPPARKKPIRKSRATAVRGAVLIGQDGEMVQYKKKCTRCGTEESTRSTMRITIGTSRAQFFCPKCRKMSDVLIQGTS